LFKINIARDAMEELRHRTAAPHTFVILAGSKKV